MRTGRVLVLILSVVGLVSAGLIIGVHAIQAATTQFGCPAEILTVQTGQTFYFTVVVSDVVDLYGWQSDFRYDPNTLELISVDPGPFLRSDGTEQFTLEPKLSAGQVERVAVTRLSSFTGAYGGGAVAYLTFKAIQDTGTSPTIAKVENAILVDSNAQELEKELIQSGECRVVIRDDAPIFNQPPIGGLIFLPMVKR